MVKRKLFTARESVARLAFPVLLVVWMVLLFSAPGFAQTSDDLNSLKKRMDKIEDEQKQVQKQLEAIHKLLLLANRQNAGHQIPNVQLNLDGAPFQGEKTAKITLVEYFDYQCPFCGGFASRTLTQIAPQYIWTGAVKFVLRDFPLETAHPQALKAAEAARCAGDQGKYWLMHEQLMGNPGALDRASLSRYAKKAGIDVAGFDACVDTDKYAASIRQDMAEGEKAGVDGTPVFFLGITEADGKTFKSSQVLEGAVSFARLKQAIDLLLDQQEKLKGNPPTVSP